MNTIHFDWSCVSSHQVQTNSWELLLKEAFAPEQAKYQAQVQALQLLAQIIPACQWSPDICFLQNDSTNLIKGLKKLLGLLRLCCCGTWACRVYAHLSVALFRLCFVTHAVSAAVKRHVESITSLRLGLGLS